MVQCYGRFPKYCYDGQSSGIAGQVLFVLIYLCLSAGLDSCAMHSRGQGHQGKEASPRVRHREEEYHQFGDSSRLS